MQSKTKNHISLYAPTKRKRGAVIDEIIFDPEARREFLTGFHKRKLQRQKHAQEISALKLREEKRKHRAKLRADRQANLEQHLAAISGAPGANEIAKDINVPEELEEPQNREDWSEIDAEDYEDKYEEDEQATTVTVEPVDITRGGLRRRDGAEDYDTLPGCMQDDQIVSHNQTPMESPVSSKPKRRKKKFRYESRAERQVSRLKEKAAIRAKADQRRRQ